MKSRYDIEKKQGFLCLTITGRYDKADFMGYPKIIAGACETEKTYNILVNGLNITGTDMPNMDRFFVAESIVASLSPNTKMAVVWPREHINEFAETVAVNRGIRMKMFDNTLEAEQWLLEIN